MSRPGIPDEVVDGFLEVLGRRGHGSYTARSYRLGLAHFSRWLSCAGRGIDDVNRTDVVRYIAEFAAGTGQRHRRGGVVDLATGQPVALGRAAKTVNHRLSVLASFFAFLIERDGEAGGSWAGRVNPVPAREAEAAHGMGGGGHAPPRRARAELRRREARELPKVLEPAQIQRLVDATRSRRDKALLVLLSRTGQRIGDWSGEHGRHGVLGMGMSDLDHRSSCVIVRLKGARDEHRVPVPAQFWTLLDEYLQAERKDAPGEALWLGLRRGWPRPLSYAAFEASLRALSTRTGVPVTAHMFRHTVATHVVAASGVAVAQQLLGHRHVGTTVDTYAHVDTHALVAAVADVERQTRAQRTILTAGRGGRYAFHYDSRTVAELEAVAMPRQVMEGPA